MTMFCDESLQKCCFAARGLAPPRADAASRVDDHPSTAHGALHAELEGSRPRVVSTAAPASTTPPSLPSSAAVPFLRHLSALRSPLRPRRRRRRRADRRRRRALPAPFPRPLPQPAHPRCGRLAAGGGARSPAPISAFDFSLQRVAAACAAERFARASLRSASGKPSEPARRMNGKRRVGAPRSGARCLPQLQTLFLACGNPIDDDAGEALSRRSSARRRCRRCSSDTATSVGDRTAAACAAASVPSPPGARRRKMPRRRLRNINLSQARGDRGAVAVAGRGERRAGRALAG